MEISLISNFLGATTKAAFIGGFLLRLRRFTEASTAKRVYYITISRLIPERG
jgi:uncharacterized membrane protein YbhN (UPF0104 family)